MGSDLTRKVFGLGLARTGTTSMHHAMLELGLRSAPDSVPLLDGIDIGFLSRYDCFFDNPIPFRYESLDQVCPDSRWIVTHRPLDDWLTSMEWLFGPGLDRLDPATRLIGDRVHQQVYGSQRFDAERLTNVHTHHYAKVREWVSERPHVWLELDDGFSWQPICELLGLPEPASEFPRINGRGGGSRWRRRR